MLEPAGGSMARERILVAMSGGVDSSVAAARLHDAGFEVVGITLHLWDYPEAPGGNGRARDHHGRCCAPEDQYDARRVADSLGFAHFTFDRRSLFETTVIEPFVEAYLGGQTPSPCSLCNREVKLAELFELADRLGAHRVATGHYARIVAEPGGRVRLAKGADRDKDQSYFLYASPQAWLRRLVFPLGDSTKTAVRAEAVARALPGAAKGESQELCFVGGGQTYADFVAARARDRLRPGAIVDEEGRVVGRHEGVHRFTVGQRKGLGVALGEAVFVARIDPGDARVHVARVRDADGTGSASLFARDAELTRVSLADGVALPFRAQVRVRYKHAGEAALVDESPRRRETACADEAGRVRVTFDAPVRAIAPGQVAVFYDGDRVVGGGTIASAGSSA